MPAGGYLNHPLLTLMRDMFPSLAAPSLVSHVGLVLFARDTRAASKLARRGAITKYRQRIAR